MSAIEWLDEKMDRSVAFALRNWKIVIVLAIAKIFLLSFIFSVF